MKSTKKFLIFIIILILLIIVLISLLTISNNNVSNDKIPDGYIAVFHGGVGEQTYETYIYKKDNGNANSGFDYINVTSTTVYWGSSQWKRKITKKGSVQWTDEIFLVAQKNNAYSFVTLPNDNKTYTIEEYMKNFLMN